MIKKLLFTLVVFTTLILHAQISNGYYSSATGSGYTLKTQLKVIITSNHVDQGYDALYAAYVNTDNDSFYENDNTVLDMYSENPSGADPYNYNHGERNCGNYNSENDCYNREHIFPQGFFNSQYPMRSDIHHVFPSDGFVNSHRGNYPYGEVNNASWTSLNGSKVGPNTYDTYTGTVFEPLDEFKGDIARALLYFAVRYEDEVTSGTWDAHTTDNNPLNGTNDQVYEDWYIKLLYKWHTDDPVSEREIVRNNGAYTYQGNRNPFVDHPEYVEAIWGSVLSIEEYSITKNITISPNPLKEGLLTITSNNSLRVTQLSIYDINGKELIVIKNPNKNINLDMLHKGIYIIKLISANGIGYKKLVKN